MALEELADLDLWVGTFREWSQSALQLLILMILHRHEAVIRGRGSALSLWPEVDIVQSAVGLASSHLVSELAFASARIVIIEDVQVAIPRCTEQVVLVFSLPVDKTGDVLVLLVVILVAPPTGALLSLSVVVRLAEPLLFHAVFHIKAVGATALVTHVQLALALIQAHARQVGMADVPEHILQAAIGRIPDLDAFGVRCDERVEDGVVEDAEAGILVG